MRAMLYKIATLSTGEVSVIFRIPFEDAERAFALNRVFGRPLLVEVREL